MGDFTLSDLLDKPWSQVSSLLPPGTCLQFLSRIGFSIPTALRFSSNVANSRSRAFRPSFLCKKKFLRVCALGENWTREVDFGRHEDNLPSHRECRPTVLVYMCGTPMHVRYDFGSGPGRNTCSQVETPLPLSLGFVLFKRSNINRWVSRLVEAPQKALPLWVLFVLSWSCLASLSLVCSFLVLLFLTFFFLFFCFPFFYDGVVDAIAEIAACSEESGELCFRSRARSPALVLWCRFISVLCFFFFFVTVGINRESSSIPGTTVYR